MCVCLCVCDLVRLFFLFTQICCAVHDIFYVFFLRFVNAFASPDKIDVCIYRYKRIYVYICLVMADYVCVPVCKCDAELF